MATFSVVTYGADPTGAADSTAKIQAALDAVGLAGGGTLLFPKGLYTISSYLQIKPPGNITIEATGAVIKRRDGSAGFTLFKNYSGSTNYPGFSGPSNITFHGGYLDMNCTTNREPAQAISIAHSENLTISSVIIQNGIGGHAIEVNSTRTALLHNITLRGFIMTSENVGEAIQIDGAFSAAMIGSAPWDQTACNGITVRDCVMVPYAGLGVWGSFVGTHSGRQDLPHANINITDNVITSNSHYAIKAMNWVNVLIARNTVSKGNAGLQIVVRDNCLPVSEEVTQTQYLTVMDNTFTDMGNNPWSCVGQLTEVINIQGLPLPYSRVDDVTLIGNVIDRFDNPIGVRIDRAGDITLTGNTITNPRYESQRCVTVTDSQHVALVGTTISGPADAVTVNTTTDYIETGTTTSVIPTEEEIMPNVQFVENLTTCVITSPTYVWGNPLSANIVCPPSRRVKIDVQFRGSSSYAWMANSFRISNGPTGPVVLAESDARNAQMDDNGDKTVGISYVADFSQLPGDVQPGDTVTVTLYHRVPTNATGTLRGRWITLESVNG